MLSFHPVHSQLSSMSPSQEGSLLTGQHALSQRKWGNVAFHCFLVLHQVTVYSCDKRDRFLRAKEHVLLSRRNVVTLGSDVISFKNPFRWCVIPKESVQKKNKTLVKYHKLNTNVTAIRVKKWVKKSQTPHSFIKFSIQKKKVIAPSSFSRVSWHSIAY